MELVRKKRWGFSIIQPARISGYDDGSVRKKPKGRLEEIE
jgi:hypothetical protein